MAKALLLVPPTGLFVRQGRCQSSVDDFAVAFARPPMDLLLAAAHLLAEGHEAAVRDYPMAGDDWSALEEDLRRLTPDLVVISTTAATFGKDLGAAKAARLHCPEATTAAIGFVENDEAALAAEEALDLIVRGEDLSGLVEVASERPISEISGLTHREGSQIRRTADRPPPADLDALPFPARHLLDPALYRRPDTNRPCAHVEVGRGCPGRCVYCLAGPVHGTRPRRKSPGRVVEELRSCIDELGLKDFHLAADTFTLDKAWVLELCRRIRDELPPIEWFCNSRVDCLDDERAAAMAEAGCFAVGLGIESGSQLLLDEMGKGVSLEQCREAVTCCHRCGLMAYTYFLIGLPWDTAETVRETLRFSRELGGDFADFFIPYPFPGTELRRMADAEELLVEGGSDRAYAGAALRSRSLSPEELAAFRREGLRDFYLRPSYILRRLLSRPDPRIWWRYARHGLALLAKLARKDG